MITKHDIIRSFYNKGKIVPKRCTPNYIKQNGLTTMVDHISILTSFLNNDPNVTLGRRIRCIKQDITSYPECKNPSCSNKVHLRPGGNLFNDFCSTKCASSDEETRIKVASTNLDRYGHICSVHNPEINEKVRNTMFDRYGVEHAAQNENILKKIRETTIGRYGVDNVAQSDEVKEKTRQTNLERYGVESVVQSDEVKNKIRNTVKHRYGVDHIFESNEIKEKIKQSHLDRYGVENAAQSYEVKNKMRQTMLDRYGVENIFQSEEFKQNRPVPKWKEDHEKIIHMIKTEGMSSKDLMEHLGLKTLSPIYNYILKELGLTTGDLTNEYTTSTMERDIIEYIQSIYDGEIVCRYRLPGRYEIDVYLPELQIGFEINGAYWHSHKLKKDDYHVMKTKLCEDMGIHLFHIYEYEWNDKKEKVLQLIDNVLVSTGTIGARQTVFGVIDASDAMVFYDKHHFDGKRGAAHHCGLFFNGILVMCASFSEHKEGMELIRLASSHRVIGGLSKIIKHMGYDTVVSFANRSRTYRHNNIYLKNGFEEIKTTPPNYVYFKLWKTLSRYQCMRHRLPSLLGDQFNPDLSEKENMINNGWLMIHDSGQLFYKWERK